MSLSKIVGVLLIAGSMFLGYKGITLISNSGTSVEVLDAEIGVSNKSKKQEGYIYSGAAILLFLGGLYSLNRK